jgi:hypothetical protein
MKSMNLDYMPPMVIGDDTGFSDPSRIPASPTSLRAL